MKVGSLALVSLVWVSCAVEALREQRESLFDPMFAFDDIDAHTVTAGNANSRDNFYRALNLSSSRPLASLPRLLEPDESLSASRQVAAGRPKFGARLQKTLAPGAEHSTTPLVLSPLKAATTASSSTNDKNQMQKRQIIQSSFAGVSQRPLDAGALEKTSSLGTIRPTSSTERPKHWSALENYYNKLRDATLLKSLQAEPLSQDELSFAVSQQSAGPDERLQNYQSPRERPAVLLPIGLTQSQDLPPIYRGPAGLPLGSDLGAQTRQNFLLPTSQNNAGFAVLPHSQQQQQHFGLATMSANLPAGLEPGLRQTPSQFERLPKFILGTNGAAPPPGVKSPPYAVGSGADAGASVIDAYSALVAPTGGALATKGLPPSRQELEQLLYSSNNNNNDNLPQLVSPIVEQPSFVPASLPVARPPAALQLPSATHDEHGKVRQFEVNKLNELLRIQEMQQRLKHQQETFGSWYDHQRSKEQLQEEAFCGPRNFVHYQLVTRNNTPVDGHAPGKQPAGELARLIAQAGLSSEQLQVPVALSAAEFPSHMGLYNGSKPSDDNYLCAATWVHERFALTLASCVAKWNASQPRRAGAGELPVLSVRAGEWNLNRSGAAGPQQQRPMVLRTVERVHLFPRYHVSLLNGSAAPAAEHNLALVEWTKPIDYFEVPYVWPACQMQSRQTLRTSSCWAPVRNVTLSEYFDAEGEGETKLKRNVQMLEVPVKLYANDELECQRQTGVHYFNFLHPNYICSADARQSSWRAKLNSPDAFGSGIYCNEGGNLSLVSILHPIAVGSRSAPAAQQQQSNSTFGYMDLSYYRPWMRSVIAGRTQ